MKECPFRNNLKEMIEEEKKNATDKSFTGLAASMNQGVILSSTTSIESTLQDYKLQVATPRSVSIPSEPSQEIMSAGIKGLSRYDVLLDTGATTGLIKEPSLHRNISFCFWENRNLRVTVQKQARHTGAGRQHTSSIDTVAA